MRHEKLHNAILRALEICSREIAAADVPGAWRTVEDLLHEGLGLAKLSRGPVVRVREFMDMPHGSVVPGVAYRTETSFHHPRVGRTDAIEMECLAAYKAQPSEVQIFDAGPPSVATPVGQVVDVEILVDYSGGAPDEYDPTATDSYRRHGTIVLPGPCPEDRERDDIRGVPFSDSPIGLPSND